MHAFEDLLSAATFSTTLDCNEVRWRVPVAEKDREKTAFVCHSGLYQFIRMSFGVIIAHETF